MPQLSLYLDEASMAVLRERAERQHVSLSRYATSRLGLREPETGWPEGYWDLFGSLRDNTFAVPEELDASLDQPVEF